MSIVWRARRRRVVHPSDSDLRAAVVRSAFVGRCDACKTPIRIEGAESLKTMPVPEGEGGRLVERRVAHWFGLDPRGKLAVEVRCRKPGCAHFVRLKAVIGKLDVTVKCNQRCTGAHGETCVCSCAGSMHGIDNTPVALNAARRR